MQYQRALGSNHFVTTDFSPWTRKHLKITKSRRLESFCNHGLQSVDKETLNVLPDSQYICIHYLFVSDYMKYPIALLPFKSSFS